MEERVHWIIHSLIHHTEERYPPIYTFIGTGQSWFSDSRAHDTEGLTAGIAGSVTTFSSWMLKGYQSFDNFNDYNHSGFYNVS